MFRDKRLFVFIIVLICLSIWQVTGPGPPLLISFSNSVPAFYTLATSNSSHFTYPLQNLTDDDYERLINITDFKFKRLNTVCDGAQPLLLILVHTSPANFAKRKTIRETWGQKRDNVRIAFMLGEFDNVNVTKELEEEHFKHRDFVQGNFIDSYRNMTYKHGMVFKYAVYHCPDAKYILKTDDDIYVNTPTMLDFLTQDLSPYGASNLLLCNIYRKPRVLRSYRSKWHVSKCRLGVAILCFNGECIF